MQNAVIVPTSCKIIPLHTQDQKYYDTLGKLFTLNQGGFTQCRDEDGILVGRYHTWDTIPIPLSSSFLTDSNGTLKVILSFQCESGKDGRVTSSFPDILTHDLNLVGQCLNLPPSTMDLKSVKENADLEVSKYFLSETLSDVTLVTGSGEVEFPAHRFVLSCKALSSLTLTVKCIMLNQRSHFISYNIEFIPNLFVFASQGGTYLGS